MLKLKKKIKNKKQYAKCNWFEIIFKINKPITKFIIKTKTKFFF